MNNRRKFLKGVGMAAPAALVASQMPTQSHAQPMTMSLNIDGQSLAQRIVDMMPKRPNPDVVRETYMATYMREAAAAGFTGDRNSNHAIQASAHAKALISALAQFIGDGRPE